MFLFLLILDLCLSRAFLFARTNAEFTKTDGKEKEKNRKETTPLIADIPWGVDLYSLYT